MKKCEAFFSSPNTLYYQDPITTSEIVSIAVLIFAKMLFMVLIIKSGFVGLTGDDFARQLAAYAWSQEAYFPRGVWPPLQFWILGSLMKIYPNISAVNLFVNGLFSALTMICLYFLVRLFFERKIAILTLAIVVVFPWQLKLSISGLCEPISHFFLIAALFCLFKWEATQKTYIAILCAMSLLFANMLRIEAWVFYVAVSTYVTINYIYMPASFKNKKVVFVILFVPLVFICFWIGLGRLQTNLGLLRQQIGLSSIYLRALRYPGYLFLVSPIIALGGIVGLFPFVRHNIRLSLRYVFVPILYLLGLIGISVIARSDSMAAPLRFVVPFVYLLVPVSLFPFFRSGRKIFSRIGYVFLVMVLAWNVVFTFKFHKNDFVDIAQVAKIIRTAWSTGIINDEQTVLFEKNSLNAYKFDHLALNVLTNRPRDIFIFDRSSSEYLVDHAVDEAKHGKFGALIASSRDVKGYLSKFCREVTDVGPYRIFWTKKDFEHSKSSDILNAKSPDHIVNIEFGECARLTGYSLSGGLFPFGVTTYWEIIGDQQLPLEIQYAIILKEAGSKPSIFASHKLGDLSHTISKHKKKRVADWQELILSKKAPPATYTVAVRLHDGVAGNRSCSSDSYYDGEWRPFAEVSLITDRRDVLRRLINGSLVDYSVGLKVIVSLFGG